MGLDQPGDTLVEEFDMATMKLALEAEKQAHHIAQQRYEKLKRRYEETTGGLTYA